MVPGSAPVDDSALGESLLLDVAVEVTTTKLVTTDPFELVSSVIVVLLGLVEDSLTDVVLSRVDVVSSSASDVDSVVLVDFSDELSEVSELDVSVDDSVVLGFEVDCGMDEEVAGSSTGSDELEAGGCEEEGTGPGV